MLVHPLRPSDRPAATTSVRVAQVATRTGVGSPPPPPRGPHRARRLVVGALLAVVTIVGGGLAYLWWPRPATPITEQKALDQFRSGDVTTEPDVAAERLMAPGVYRYTAVGTESVSIGGLPLPSRQMPELVTLVVQPADDCILVTLNLMAEHTETTTYCPADDGGIVLVDQTKRQEVSGFTTNGATRCTQGALGRPGDPPLPVACVLELETAGTAMDVDLVGTAVWAGSGTIDVGGEPRRADGFVLDLAASGDFTGHMIERQWVDRERAVPLRIERDIDLEGPGHFVESTTLDLLDLEPTR